MRARPRLRRCTSEPCRAPTDGGPRLLGPPSALGRCRREPAPERTPAPKKYDVFVSYASKDRELAVEIIEQLKRYGITFWRDNNEILGGECYGSRIVEAIQNCQVVLLMCSQSAVDSRNVIQEIRLAWHYHRPYLPLLLDDSFGKSYPDQIQYWLEGTQWIRVGGRRADDWLTAILRALRALGVDCRSDRPPR